MKCYATLDFRQHGTYDTTYDTLIVASLTTLVLVGSKLNQMRPIEIGYIGIRTNFGQTRREPSKLNVSGF
jgi:hypothetical protein